MIFPTNLHLNTIDAQVTSHGVAQALAAALTDLSTMWTDAVAAGAESTGTRYVALVERIVEAARLRNAQIIGMA